MRMSEASPARQAEQAIDPACRVAVTTAPLKQRDEAPPPSALSVEPSEEAAARSRVGTVATVALASRLFTWAVASLATAWLSARPRSQAAESALAYAGSLLKPQSTLGILFGPWGNWDGAWFTSIASRGYVRLGGPAFFPLYPLTMHAAAPLFGGRYVIAGVLLSLLFFILACLLLYRLVAQDFSPRIALWVVVYLSVFPTSFFFGAAYSESLFLLTTVACFYFARQRRFWLAGLAGFAAALTRNAGVLVLVPLAMYYFGDRRWKLRRVDRQAASLLLVPAGLAAYMAFLWVRFGDPFYFLHAEDRWRRSFALPTTTIYRAVVNVLRIARELVASRTLEIATLHNVIAFLALCALLALISFGWRRLPAPYTAYAVVSLLLPLCYPERTMPLMSLARFALVIFPAFAAMALVVADRPRLKAAVLAVSIGGLALLTAVFALRLTFVG
jgi:hypothetical protein